jgi:uncharacterized protein YjbI with pentapeptide repeats
VLLEHAILTAACLESLSARDVIFKRSDLSGTQCAKSSFLRVSLSDCRASGLDASKATYKEVTLTDCKLDMANFRFAKLTNVRFVDCVLTEADFLGAELSNVSFERCLLERTNFTQCKLKNVDLRSSQLISLIGWQHLKGAIIDTAQLMTAAPHLANELGITIQD